MTEEQPDQANEQWGAAAQVWARAAEEEETGASASATSWMLGAAALQPGNEVLELACGAGRVGLQAAALVQPSGRVLCSDLAEPMVQAVKDRVSKASLASVEARVLDAQDLTLDSEQFDLVLCRFGYMLMADPQRAIEESLRVLRPGGRLVLAVWGAAETNPWLALILGAVMSQLDAPPLEPGTPGPFALGDSERLQQLLRTGGFAEVGITEIETEQVYDSLDGWWQQILEVGGPLAAALSALSEVQVDAIKAAALDGAEPYLGSDGRVVFPARILGAQACRPAGD
jgi:SAM-dependent methyltransferase